MIATDFTEPLAILYRDDFLVAIDKPAGMMVHPAANSPDDEPSAMKRLRDQIGQRVFPVHRLDRPTSGVLLFALDKKSASIVQQAFERREVVKTYLAIVCGNVPEKWICDSPLAADTDDRLLPARTSFERLASINAEPGLVLSLVKAVPTTGRFHQIRRHLLEAGHPIVGDFRYAGMDRSFRLGEILGTGTRMFLHATTLKTIHPKSEAPLLIESQMASDFQSSLPLGKIKWCARQDSNLNGIAPTRT